MIINFDNRTLDYKEILEKVSEKDIYEYYLGHNIKEGILYKCPFHEDTNPSLGFKLMPSMQLIHRCFGCGERGNSINFVRKLLKLSFSDTIKQLNKDMIIKSASHAREDLNRRSLSFSIESKTKIYPVFQNFNITDYDYWNKYNIPLSLLNKYSISACKQIWLRTNNNHLVLFAEYSKTNPIYCYTISDSYKIYRPLNPTKIGKWLTTSKAEDIQGMRQLPSKGKLLIITSSMKDVLVLKVLGYSAIALGGEGNRIPAKILDYLKACFEDIVIFYDNDKPGINYARKLSEEIDSDYIYIPEEFFEKDISDYIDSYKIEQTRSLIINLLINGRRSYKEETVYNIKEN